MTVRIKDLASGTPTGAEFLAYDSASGGTKKRSIATLLSAVPTVTIGDGTGVVTIQGDGDDSIRVLGGLGVTGNAYVTGVLQVNTELDAETLVVYDTTDLQGPVNAGAPVLGDPSYNLSVESEAADAILLGRLALNTIQPSQITTDQTAYAPTGMATATALEITTDASSRAIRSMVGTGSNVKTFYNAGSFNLIFRHEYTSGTTAGDRFRLPRARDLVLRPDMAVTFGYDYAHQRWRVLSETAPQPRQIANGGAAITAASYTILPGDDIILVDTTSNAVALTRPAFDQLERLVVKTAGGTNGITLVRLASEKINGVAATYTLPGSTTAWASATPQAWMFFDDGTDTQVC